MRYRRAVQGLWEAVERKQSRGGFARGAQSSIDLADIKTLVDAISSLLEVFQLRERSACCTGPTLTDCMQFESNIAIEKRLGLIVEHLKRPQKVIKAIKSGTLNLDLCRYKANADQHSVTTLFLRRPTTSSPATPAV